MSFYTLQKWHQDEIRNLIILLCIGQFLSAQPIKDYDLEMQAKHAELKGYDPSFRVNYFENIILKTFFKSNATSFQYRTLDGAKLLDLVPAGEFLIGLSFDYKWVAFEASFSPGFLINNEVENPNATAYNINLNFFYSDRWRQEFRLTFNEGFLNRSSNEGINTFDEPTFDNTTLLIIQGSTFFITNRNYSYRAHYAQTERQLKSAGSFIPRIRYTYSEVDPNLEEESEFQTLQFSSIDILGQIGYLYTFVTKQTWFATIGLHAGAGYNNVTYKVENSKNQIFDSFVYTFEPQLAAGYNNYRWFFGASGNWRNFNNANEGAGQFSRDQTYFEIHVGYRLNDNKSMRKFFGWFEDHLGF
ncbi:MAG: DUF4421 family protein [Bacteroidota bacterium]